MSMNLPRAVLAALLLPALTPAASAPRDASTPAQAPFVLEQTYWIKPGRTQQFVALFRKNRLPLLQAEIKEGRILWIRMAQPRITTGNDQWDFKLTVAWRDAQSAWDEQDPTRHAAAVFKDQERFTLEESLRNELVVERTDVPLLETVVE